MSVDVDVDVEDRDEMPRWVRKLLWLAALVAMVVGGFVVINGMQDDAQTKAETDVQCKVYGRC